MNDQSRNASPSSRPPSRAHQVIDMKAADSMEAAELVEDAETLQEPISSVRDGSNPWEKCIKLSKKYDDELCDALKGELDNLMLFATLFSAIVTAFTIDSYKWLEPDSGSSLTMPVAVQVNVLWFLSLASSLGVASTGILCMQWVRHYGLQEPKPTADSLAQRRQRYNGFRKWRVRDIISLLPVLLQLALVLFGIGLIRFLWALDHTVGVGFMVVSVITIAFVLVTMFAPILQWWFLHLPWSWLKTTQCPFQSPQAWIFYSISWWLAAPVRDPKKFESDPGNWRTFDESWLEWHAGPIKSKSSKDKKGDDPKNYADNPLVDVSYKVKLICEELIWLDDMFSDNLEGIKARAEALGRLPFKAAKYVVRNKLNSYARRHVRQRRTSEPGPEQPEQPDIKELFKLLTPFDQIGRLSSPDQAVGDEDRRHDRDFKHLRAWYLWAHAQDHLGLDDAYMESRIQFMSEVPRDHILLPALPRSSHLDVYCLVKTKEGGKDDQIVPRFLICLKMLIQRKKLTSDNSIEMWAIIGDLLEYSIRHNYTQYFPELGVLFNEIMKSEQPPPTISENTLPSLPQTIPPTIPPTIHHILDGLRFIFDLGEVIQPLKGKGKAGHIRRLLNLVVQLRPDPAQTVISDWDKLESVLRIWTNTPKPAGDHQSDKTGVSGSGHEKDLVCEASEDSDVSATFRSGQGVVEVLRPSQ